jgi:hypothetical protein
MTHAAVLTRPTVYTVAYACQCGWVSDTVLSDQLGAVGAQLVRHQLDQRTTMEDIPL